LDTLEDLNLAYPKVYAHNQTAEARKFARLDEVTTSDDWLRVPRDLGLGEELVDVFADVSRSHADRNLRGCTQHISFRQRRYRYHDPIKTSLESTSKMVTTTRVAGASPARFSSLACFFPAVVPAQNLT